MIHYLDASFLVATLTEEARTEDVRQWLDVNSGAGLAISPWIVTEVASALSIKVRTGALPIEQRNEVMGAWVSLRKNAFAMLPVTTKDFELAALFADRHDLGLRAGDALHVAIAAANGCTLVTLDRVLAAAAPQCGVPVVGFDA